MSSLQVMNTLIIFSSTNSSGLVERGSSCLHDSLEQFPPNDSGLVERGSSCLQDSLEQIPTNGRAVASLKKVAVA